jgi:crotonobetainyl-CoA:carnitine CoA-transferase CaiB-like acyl-CoA transferase
MSGPLKGLRILDLSRVLAGPWATQFFADLGADVIKVERPGQGDDTRQWGPPWLKDDQGSDTGESAYYLSCNRGKRSIVLDLSTAEGQSVVKRIAMESDVLIENFKVGSLQQYGLDFDRLHVVNPRLIYCSITGFGQTGPNAHRAGYDAMIQGEAGLMSLTGEHDGPPMKTGVAVADLSTGMYAAASVLAAVYARQQSGLGQHIDIALHDVQLAGLAYHAQSQLMTGRNPGRHGNAHPNIVPYQAFAVADGHLMLAIGNDNQFKKFCEVAGLQALAEDEHFKHNADRVSHRNELLPLLERTLRLRSINEWRTALDAEGVPCGPVNTLDQVMASTQVISREMTKTAAHPQCHSLRLLANPIKFSGTPLSAPTAPPLLGQHSEEILAEFGFGEAMQE